MRHICTMKERATLSEAASEFPGCLGELMRYFSATITFVKYAYVSLSQVSVLSASAQTQSISRLHTSATSSTHITSPTFELDNRTRILHSKFRHRHLTHHVYPHSRPRCGLGERPKALRVLPLTLQGLPGIGKSPSYYPCSLDKR